MAKVKDSKGPEATPLLGSSRLALSIISFLGFVNLYAQRVNLSVAMVCMVNHTYVSTLHESSIALSIGNNSDGGINNTSAVVMYMTNNSNNDTANGGGGGGGGGGDGCNANAAGKSNETRAIEDGEMEWSKEVQGLILGSFFWGYLVTQVPGGWLSTRYGGKRVFGYSIFLCSVCTLFMPLAARTHWAFLLVLRILAGLCQGVVWPAMQMLWVCWAPPLEMGKLTGFCYAGSQIGNVLTFPLAALLCKYGFDGGWPAIFYVIGGAGVLWFFAWMFMAYDTPSQHPRVSEEERAYIEASLAGRSGPSNRKGKIPWVTIITSKRVWAIIVTHMCANWGTYTFLTNIPTYMKEVLKFDIKQNGALSSLPYIGFWLIINVSGMAFDYIQTKGWLTTTASRKVGNSLGQILPGIFVIAVGFMDCTNAIGAVVLLTIGVAMCGNQYGSGFVINSNDIAPRYSSIIFGISNTFGTIPGFLAPIAIGIITKGQTQSQWQIVFFICAGIYLFGTIFYIIFGTGELQEWACQDVTLEVAPPLLEKDKSDQPLVESRPVKRNQSPELDKMSNDNAV